MSTAQLVFKRYETEYLLDAGQRAALEGVLAERMVPDEHGPSTVRNVYYDTPTALLARRSAEHPAYKEKIRTRCYGAPHPFDPVFVELKKKCDGVVYKRRCELAPAVAVQLADEDGNVLASCEARTSYSCVLVSAPGIETGKAYTLTCGGASSEVTMDSLVYSNVDRAHAGGAIAADQPQGAGQPQQLGAAGGSAGPK